MPVFRPTQRLLRRSAATIATIAVTVTPSLATTALTTAAQAAPLRGSAASYSLQYNADKTVVRWDACAPIHYRVNVSGAPTGALSDVQGAVSRVAAATGMSFVYDGSTSVVPTKTYGQNVPLDSTPPLVFAWASPGVGTGKSDALTSAEAGKGGFATRSWTKGREVHPWRIFTGFVVVNKSYNTILPAGFATGRASRGGLLMHELAHAVGLGHTGDVQQIMYPLLVPYASWGAGDTAGLRRVGRPAGCISGVKDFTGDGRSDPAVYRPSTGTWYVKSGTGGTYGGSTDVPVPADYTGDGRLDIAIWRPSTGAWWVRGNSPVSWGQPGDIPVPGDYNGDGRDEFAIYRPSTGTWWIRGMTAVTYGAATDVPVPANYSGDRRTEIAVWRPSTGIWYIRGSASVDYGQQGDIVVPGDYNGDRLSEPAVWRRSAYNTSATWLAPGFTYAIGSSGDVPVPGDYNGDGRTDPAVRTPTGIWTPLDAPSFPFGASGDIPLALPAAIRMTQLGTR